MPSSTRHSKAELPHAKPGAVQYGLNGPGGGALSQKGNFRFPDLFCPVFHRCHQFITARWGQIKNRRAGALFRLAVSLLSEEAGGACLCSFESTHCTYRGVFQRLKSPAWPWPLEAVMLSLLHGPIQTPLSFAEHRHQKLMSAPAAIAESHYMGGQIGPPKKRGTQYKGHALKKAERRPWNRSE